MTVKQCDLAKSDIPYDENTHDFAILIFVLSAIFPKYHLECLTKIYNQLKPGGILYFRDYGKYDLAELRFASKKKSKVQDNFYVRHDTIVLKNILYHKIAPMQKLFVSRTFNLYCKIYYEKSNFCRSIMFYTLTFFAYLCNTLAYYFTIEEVDQLLTQIGFTKISIDYQYRVIENRKQESKMHRVWIQAKYQK